MSSSRAPCARWIIYTTRGVLSWVSRRVGGRSQPDRAGGVKPDETGPQQERCGFTPPDRSGSVYGDDATRDPGQRRPQDQPPPGSATPGHAKSGDQRTPAAGSRTPHSRSEAARRAGAAGGPALDFRRPPNAAATRPHDVCAVTRTDARSCPHQPPAASATSVAQPNCATNEATKTRAKP